MENDCNIGEGMIQTKFKNEENFEERVKKKGGFIVIVAIEPCFTCGHKKQMVYPEKTDGRTEIKKKCLMCSVRVPTKVNRNGP